MLQIWVCASKLGMGNNIACSSEAELLAFAAAGCSRLFAALTQFSGGAFVSV